MSPDLLFKIANLAVLPAWLLIAIAPRWVWTERLVFHAWVPIALAVAYVFAFASAMPFPDGAGFDSVSGVSAFFQIPYVAVAGWIHYLAFDLFVGCWEVRDARRNSIPHLAILPALFLTLYLGPVGLGLYLLLRAVLRRRLTLVEVASPPPA